MEKGKLRIFVAISFLGLLSSVSFAQTTTVSGMGHYCSGTWPTGGWAFTSDTTGGDPCKAITSTGGTVRRKGLYANNNWNRVVYRCYPPNYGFVGIYEGWGNGPMTAAFNEAKKDKKPGCVFNVSPKSMTIFDSPFPLKTKYSHSNGVDFARGKTLNVNDFGQSGSTTAKVVDWKGREVSYGDEHAGHDWNMPKGTEIRAVAAGVVVSARIYDSGACTDPQKKACTCVSDTQYQKEVSIRHTVQGNKENYFERFLTYYAHLQSYSVMAGQVVKKGEVIGYSGNTGCSFGPHLHFGVIRLTNTSDQLEEVVNFDPVTHSDAGDKLIEPYGWEAPKGFDPWSWMFYPQGALSLNLWNSGQAPSVGTW